MPEESDQVDMDVQQAPSDSEAAAVSRPAAPDIAEVLSSMTIKPREDGGLDISAPREAANVLATALEKMAQLLRAVEPAPADSTEPEHTAEHP